MARHRYAYMGIPYFHISVFERMFALMRDACTREGYEADPLQLGWLVPIFVAETDEEARRRFEEHFWYFVRRLLPGINISPPGYTSVQSVENIVKNAGTFALNLKTWDQVVEGHYAIVGSPATVTELLAADVERLGVGNLLGLFQLGTLPAEDTRRNLELFATEVMPGLRSRFPGTDRSAAGGGGLVTQLVAGGLDTAVGRIEVHDGGEGGGVPLRLPPLRPGGVTRLGAARAAGRHPPGGGSRCSPASARRRASSTSTTWRMRRSISWTCSTGSAWRTATSWGCRSGDGSPPSWRCAGPSGCAGWCSSTPWVCSSRAPPSPRSSVGRSPSWPTTCSPTPTTPWRR